MKTNKDIQNKIDSTMSAMDTIGSVKVSPFFKDKTMQRLFSEKEEDQMVWSWFTPKLQLVALICIVAINVFVFTQLNTDLYNTNVNQFAETYGLTTSTETPLFK